MNSGRFEIFGIDFFKIIIVVAATGFCTIFYRLLAGQETFTHDSIIWYGSFHYYVESLVNGHFPYWDPYLMTGTPFYPNISHHGLLDPVLLICTFIRKTTNISILTIYCYFRIFRLFVFSLGALFFYRHITKSNMSALVASIVLFFALPPAYFKQYGAVDVIYLTPFALYFLMLFFKTPSGPMKYIYLFCLAIVSGISMNIFIPTYYLFNLFAFMILLFFLKIVRFSELAWFIQRRKPFLSFIAAISLLGMMSAPPIMVMLKDASGGELFPITRIAQKNDNNLKKIVASEVNSSSLSGKFCNNMGVFNSYGNIVNLLYPDMDEIYYFHEHNFLSEINQYIGLIPLIFCILGFFYSKSRYRWLAIIMILFITVNSLSLEGVDGYPYNMLQRIFNEVFPPLKMIEVRETFGSFSLFYICMLLSFGLKILFDCDSFTPFVRKNYRQILAIGGSIIGLKIFITWYWGKKIIPESPQDLFSIAQVVVFLILVSLVSFRKMTRNWVVIFLLYMVFADLFLYNYLAKPNILVQRQEMNNIVEKGDRQSVDFQFFRYPIFPSPNIAFGESIVKIKSILTYGNNHSLFSTRRYYDLLTNIPLGNQLALGGVSSPIVNFFPSQNIYKTDRKNSLKYLAMPERNQTLDPLLIEDSKKGSPVGLSEVKNFSEYENVTTLNPIFLSNFVSSYFIEHGKEVEDNRYNVNRFLNTTTHTISVDNFSTNEITISLKNETDGYLFYGDGWSKYWVAFDGDREIPVDVANYNSKAVYLKEGSHTVRFIFNPIHYKIGLALYYFSLLILFGMVTFLYFTKKNGSTI